MTVRKRKWKDAFGAMHEAWCVDVRVVGRDGRQRRVQRVAPIQNRRAAERLEHEIREELINRDDNDGKLAAIVVPEFSTFAGQFMTTYATTNNKPSEVSAKESILRVHLLPQFGDHRLDQIGAAEIEAYKSKKISEKLSRKSINNHLTVLRKLLATAVEWRALNVIPKIKWLKTAPAEFDFLTREELDRLIEGAADEWRAVVIIAARTGLRQGELRALRWLDVDLDAGRLIVRRSAWQDVVASPKNGRTREVALCAQAASALREHPRRGDWVFSSLDGSMLSKGEMKWPLWRACDRVGLRRLGWHSLRHTFASHLVMRRAPLKAVQELMGHSTVEMTMRYSHLTPDARREAIRLLDLKDPVTLVWLTSRGRSIRMVLPETYSATSQPHRRRDKQLALLRIDRGRTSWHCTGVVRSRRARASPGNNGRETSGAISRPSSTTSGNGVARAVTVSDHRRKVTVRFSKDGNVGSRLIDLGPGTARLPERLLLAHSQGKVLFVAGAGISVPSDLPLFRELVLDVYEELDPAVLGFIAPERRLTRTVGPSSSTQLSDEQLAEVKRFELRDYDVVLGLLERRMDRMGGPDSKVRQAISAILRRNDPKPSAIHKALVRLADRGSAGAIVTTNFDTLLEQASRGRLASRTLGAIPRPSTTHHFSGVLHIHGCLASDAHGWSDIVVSDQDLGEFYLRRRIVPDFIYDAARLFHLVFVGYSASEAPMRYLLNAVSADESHYPDLKERFAFVDMPATPDSIALADWRARGITPIPYGRDNEHAMLANTLVAWASLSPFDNTAQASKKIMKAASRQPREQTSEERTDLADHLLRRGSGEERLALVKELARHNASVDWLEAAMRIEAEARNESLQRGPLTTERQARLVREFLRHRLQSPEILRWVLHSRHEAVRSGIVRCLADNPTLPEPWRSAWRLLQEYWALGREPEQEYGTGSPSLVGASIESGDRSGAMIQEVLQLVSPRMKLHPHSGVWMRPKRPRRPKEIGDLVWAELTSIQVFDPSVLRLVSVDETNFLQELASRLDSMIVGWIHITQRTSGTPRERPWVTNRVNRVYFVAHPTSLVQGDESADPDTYNEGIAPAIKTMFAVVERLLRVDIHASQVVARRWRAAETSLHTRLWAALARNAEVVPAEEVAQFLSCCCEDEFWDTDAYPEIAEMRARRFAELSQSDAEGILTRIRERPQSTDQISATKRRARERWRDYSAVRELERIRVGGSALPREHKLWLEKHLDDFTDLREMSTVEYGFPRAWHEERLWSCPDLADRFDCLNQLGALVSNSMGDT